MAIFDEAACRATCSEFWTTYYSSMKRLHEERERTATQPIRGRNAGTADSKHVKEFERFWRRQLATGLGVAETDVGPRKIKFRPHRSKNFDVCWPMQGNPKILISIKSMQNAYRNFTNRIEEAIGDSAVLRLYDSPAVFGFFFFFLDGNVPRGQADPGVFEPGKAVKSKGIPPYLDLLEEGGDFFDIGDINTYRRPKPKKPPKTVKVSKREDIVKKAELSLIDLVSTAPKQDADIHYDAIGFMPTRIKSDGEGGWQFSFSDVDDKLNPTLLVDRLLEVARLRGFV